MGALSGLRCEGLVQDGGINLWLCALALGLCLRERSQAQTGSSCGSQHLEAFLPADRYYIWGTLTLTGKIIVLGRSLFINNTFAQFIYNKKIQSTTSENN